MMRILTVTLALAATAASLLPVSAFAGSWVNGRHYSGGMGYDGDPTGETADSYANCMAYSPKLRTDVWVCGAPYPPGIPVLRSGHHGGEAYTNCLAYSRHLGTSVWVCGPPYPKGVPILAN
jgi:hypothetical protein